VPSQHRPCARALGTPGAGGGAARRAGPPVGGRGATLGEDTRYAGAFRALGLVVPVWDVPAETPGADWAGPAAELHARLADALAVTDPLTSDERRARAGLLSRQVTLR
jgi:hypothetical protein